MLTMAQKPKRKKKTPELVCTDGSAQYETCPSNPIWTCFTKHTWILSIIFFAFKAVLKNVASFS